MFWLNALSVRARVLIVIDLVMRGRIFGRVRVIWRYRCHWVVLLYGDSKRKVTDALPVRLRQLILLVEPQHTLPAQRFAVAPISTIGSSPEKSDYRNVGFSA